MYGAILSQHIFEFNWDFPQTVASFNNEGTHYRPLNIVNFLETRSYQTQSTLIVVFHHTAYAIWCAMLKTVPNKLCGTSITTHRQTTDR